MKKLSYKKIINKLSLLLLRGLPAGKAGTPKQSDTNVSSRPKWRDPFLYLLSKRSSRPPTIRRNPQDDGYVRSPRPFGARDDKYRHALKNINNLSYKKGFTFLEILLAATLFSAAMVGIIGAASSSMAAIGGAQRIRAINGAIRDTNESLSAEIKAARCVSVADNKLQIQGDGCVGTVKTIYVDDAGRLVVEANGNKSYLSSVNIKLRQIDEKSPVFAATDNRLVNVALKFETRDQKEKVSTDYRTAITRRLW